MAEAEYDVVISGGGPVGLGLAIELGQRGVRTAVIERYRTPQRVPKGQNLTQRTMEHIHAWGCEAALRAARVTPRDVANGGLVTYGTILSDYAYDWLPREKVAAFYDRGVERLPQYETERVLRARVAEIDAVDVHYGWSATGVTQDADGVQVTAREHKGEGQAVFRGRFGVGCDGSRSSLRKAAGISQTTVDHDKKMVLLVFRSTELHRMLGERYEAKAFYNALDPELKGYWKFLGRVDLGEEWFFHAPVPADTTPENFDFKAFLHRTVGAGFALEIDYVGFWDLRFAMADSYRAGRVFVAGDAAHSHPPYGGYGINTGFEDARNLGWKLAAEVQGWGGGALLDSYDAERRPVFASTSQDFIADFIETDRDFLRDYAPDRDLEAFKAAWAKRSEGDAEVQSFEPHYEGSDVVFGPVGGVCSAKGRHGVEARPGHHLTPLEWREGQSSYDLAGQGFTLLAGAQAGGCAAEFSRAAKALGLDLALASGGMKTSVAQYGAPMILLRPDRYVAWAGSDSAGAEAVLKRAIGCA